MTDLYTSTASPHKNLQPAASTQAKRCDSAARRPPCRESDDRSPRRPHRARRAWSAGTSSPCARRWWRQPIKQRQAPSRKKVEAEATAKPSMRSPRVTRSSSSPSANGACCKPAVGAWARPHTLCIQAQLLVPRLRLHSFWQSSIHARPPGIQLQRNVGPPPSRPHPPFLLMWQVRRWQRRR